jgi:hypothetical protein
MKTLALFAGSKLAVPGSTAWYLDTLGEFRGKQELYTRQSPQKLRVLREHALIESAVSSHIGTEGYARKRDRGCDGEADRYLESMHTGEMDTSCGCTGSV